MYLPKPPHALVIGCGVSGLTVAERLLACGFSVEVWGQLPTLQTTSAVAAAVWFPYLALPRERVIPWSKESYHTFDDLADLPETGVLRRQVFELYGQNRESALIRLEPEWATAIPGFGQLSPSQLPTSYVTGYRYQTFVIDMPRYLRWLVGRVQDMGGRLETRTVSQLTRVPKMRRDVAELTGCETRWEGIQGRGQQFERTGLSRHDLQIIVDCSGLGGRLLNADPATYPVMGQVIRVRNPGLQRVLVDEEHPAGLTYIVPRRDDCILGGTALPGHEHPVVCADTTASILARCRVLEPRLRDAEVLDVRSGLRPCRAEVCLSEETVGGRVVIHNYGHGGAGVTLSWGCANEVIARLAARGLVPRPPAGPATF